MCAGVCARYKRMQRLFFGEREFELVIAARPSFVAARESPMPTFVLAFNLATVLVIAVLIGKETPQLQSHTRVAFVTIVNLKTLLKLLFVVVSCSRLALQAPLGFSSHHAWRRSVREPLQAKSIGHR